MASKRLNNAGRVVFEEDMESGECSEGFSIVGPLPDTARDSYHRRGGYDTSSHCSATSTDSSFVPGRGNSRHSRGSFHASSVLKKKRNSNSTTTTGVTGSLTHTSRGSNSTNGTQTYSPGAKATPRHVWYGRWLFFFLLCMVAAILGYLTYTNLTENETFLAECVFFKVAEHAIYTISQNQKRKKLGMDTMASVIGTTAPDTEMWPFVTQVNYEAISNNIIDVSKGCNIGYGPILTPAQIPKFEAFAEDYYQNTRSPEPFPNGTGVNIDGRVAVWAVDDVTDMPYHDISGLTDWDSSRRVIVPYYQHSAGPSRKLMFNMHASPLLGEAIEKMMTCAEETKELMKEYEMKRTHTIVPVVLETHDNGDEPPTLKDCTVVTELAHNRTSTIQKEPIGPGANMLQPIFPANDETEMVGVLSTSIVWTETMANVFSANVDGIYIVLSTPTQTVTFKVEQGTPVYQGVGDLHDPLYDHVVRKGNVTLPGYFAEQSVPYTITLYPSERLFEMYSTKNPYYATIGSICVMIFTVLMFMAYDFLVRREFSAKHELLKAKRHFMRYVSHEVRTPLNSVCMGLNLMQEEIQAKLTSTSGDGSKNAMITIDEASNWLSLSRDVHISAQSATNVLNDFLNYDKIESRQLTLELSIIPFQSIISQTVTEFVLPAQNKAIKLTSLQEKLDATADKSASKKSAKKVKINHINEIESQQLEDQVVVGDKARLTQVIRNLISNAIKFTPEQGSINVKTTWIVATVGESTHVNLQDGKTEALHQTGWIQVEVSDTGPGMTEEQLATVFNSGVQFNVNKNQKGGGSGLGLYIAKGIVDQHNGTLSVSSKGLGKGSSFVCNLPVYCKPKMGKREASSVSSRDDSVTERVSSSWFDEFSERDINYRILVVDDAPMNRKLLTRLLLKRGHHVDMAENGLQALEKVIEQREMGQRYDTILMDFQMPVMDGPTATRKIRAEGCDSFIIGITGNVLPQDIEHFKACGADGVLGKPFQIEELESMWVEYGVGF